MKKVLIILNKYDDPDNLVNCAAFLASKERLKVNAIFLSDTNLSDDRYPFPSDLNLTDVDYTKEDDRKTLEHLEETEMDLFRKLCESKNIDCYIHPVSHSKLTTIVDESCFADIIICNSKLNSSIVSVASLLPAVQCPVLLVPDRFTSFDNIICTYDGRISSIYAMKQFAYLFPWTESLVAWLLSVLPENIRQMEYEALVDEWLRLHFPKMEIAKLKGSAKRHISGFINEHKSSLVVMGAYGRSALSRFFKKSMSDYIMKKTDAPIFITHTK